MPEFSYYLLLFSLALSSISLSAFFHNHQKGFWNFSKITLGIAFILQAGFLLAWFQEKGIYFPTTGYERHISVLGVLLFLTFMMSFKRNRLVVVLLTLPFLMIGAVGSIWLYPKMGVIPIPSLWIWTHILLMVLGEVLFFLAAIVSVVYLWADHQFLKKKSSYLLLRLPALIEVEDFLKKIMRTGFLLLTLGLGLGFLFARLYWEPKWVFDAKVISALLTWVFYAAVLWMKPLSRDRRMAWAAVTGFVVILFMTFGIEKIFQTQRIEYGSRSEKGDHG